MAQEGGVVKPKKPLQALTINECLGDIPTHFMKSGSAFRPKEDLNDLAEFRKRVIRDSFRGRPFEYDIWFNTNEVSTIRAWLYTDFLGKGIVMRVPSIKINDKFFAGIVNGDIEIDEDRIQKIKDNLHNKYVLQTNPEYYDKVIFPPGSNLMYKNTLDWNKMRQAVADGFVVKPHPITAHIWMALLREKLGADKILNKKSGGFELLMNAKEVACAPNSEMGLIAILLGKKLRLVSTPKDVREKNLLTYESFYYAISNHCSQQGAYTALCKLLSAKHSGIIFNFDNDAEERMDRYLHSFWEYKMAK